MGSKIPKAKLEGGLTMTAEAYEDATKKVGLFCASAGCSAQLSFVQRHKRKYESKTIEIPPCFRLKKYENHADSCKFNIGGQLKIVAKHSDSDVFAAVNESKFEFRLHILLKAFRELTTEDIEALGRQWGSATAQNKQYDNKGHLQSYLRTLGQILELRTLCEDNSELKTLVTLKHNGKKIPWDQFYFDHHNLITLPAIYGNGRTETYIDIPLAICSHVESKKPPTDTFKCHTVNLSTPFISPDENNLITKPTVQISLKNPNLAAQLTIGKEYVFFGKWRIRPRFKDKTSETGLQWLFQNIEMAIYYSDHFIEC